jgi:protein gp37
MTELPLVEITETSWNPVRGCTKVSPGCARCYAEVFANRFAGVPGHPYEQGFALRLVPEKLAEPLRWASPKRVFVNSMSDLFHEEVPDDYIVEVGRVMQQANWHLYGILTKRSERMRDLLRGPLRFAAEEAHIWWGVSVENRKHGLPRVGHLRSSGARSRVLCAEPLLEDLGPLDLAGVGWVIVGGEAGRDARPLAKEWVLSIRDQCHAAGVPFFFKQGGGGGKNARNRQLDGRTYEAFPAHVTPAVPGRALRQAMVAQAEALNRSRQPRGAGAAGEGAEPR